MLNKVQLIGNLGKDPELKHTQSGTAVCSFTVATSKSWVDQNGNKKEKTEWHNITVWNRGQGKQAENCAKYLSKGKKVYVEGELETRQWLDERSGEKRFATGITAIDVKFLSPNNDGQQQQRPNNQLQNMQIPDFHPSAEPSANHMPDYDSIPF